MSAALQQNSDQYDEHQKTIGDQSLLKISKCLNEVWLQLETLCGHPVDINERLKNMLWLRETLSHINNELTQDGRTLLELPISIFNLMINAAEHLCDWSLVIYLREMLDERLRSENSEAVGQDTEITDKTMTTRICENILLLAVAYRQMGLLLEAQECIRMSLLQHYNEPKLIHFYQQLRDEYKALQFNPDDLVDDSIVLTPLTEKYLVDFYWQYADPEIAELCNLPIFTDDQHWLDWQAFERMEEHKYIFAVIHREWGFIGSVSLEVIEGVGFFYYWLGSDFQGHGFGPQAVNILLQWGASHLGMHCCYAKAFEHNVPSHKALGKLGFKQLPFDFEAPYDNECLFYYGPDKPEKMLVMEFEQLLFDQDSMMCLSVPLALRMGLNDEVWGM